MRPWFRETACKSTALTHYLQFFFRVSSSVLDSRCCCWYHAEACSSTLPLLPARCRSGDSVAFSLFAMRSPDTLRPGVTDFNSTAAGVCYNNKQYGHLFMTIFLLDMRGGTALLVASPGSATEIH